MNCSIDKKGFIASTASETGKAVRNIQKGEQDVDASRRRFMCTLGMGAAALAATACGGGGALSSDGGAPAPGAPSKTITALGWYTVPTITFTEGVAASISIAGYVSNAGSVEIAKNSAALPPGVTYDAGTKSFLYDGVGAVGYTDGHVLTATEK
jgi:hypothetical protein